MRFLLVLAIVMLAGCSQTAPSPSEEPSQDLPAVTAGPDTGAIQGVVFDPAIQPIAGATVTLQSSGANTTTGESGGFGFSDLPPGTYFLKVQSSGHFEVTQAVEVQAGAIAKMKILMQIDEKPIPYDTTYQHFGFVGLWVPGPSYVVQLLYTNDDVCDCEMRIEPGTGIEAFVFEAVWDASVEVPEMDQMSWELDSYVGSSLDHQEGEYSTSPVYSVLKRDLYSAEADNWLARMTPGIAAGIYVQQDYEMYVTAFYHGLPPEGWSLVQRDT